MFRIAKLHVFIRMLFLFLPFHIAHSATIDVDDASGCTLRDAILSANSDMAVGNCAAGNGADIITLLPKNHDVSNSSLPVTSPIAIEGVSGAFINKDASTGIAHRLFTLSGSSASLSISDVEIYGDFTYSISGNGGCFFLGSGSSLTLQDSVLELCLSDANGGAIYVESGAEITINNSRVNNNIALLSGGGIYSAGSLLINSASRVANNKSNLGGGIYLDSGLVTLELEESSIDSNEALQGAGLYASSSGSISMTNCTISGNQATGGKAPNFGGGIYLADSSVSLNNCTVAENSADDQAGAIYGTSSTINIDNSIVAGNSVGSGGLGAEVYLVAASGMVTESSIFATSNNVLGDSSKTNADAFFGYTPDASVKTATSDGSAPASISAIIETATDHTTASGDQTYAHALIVDGPADNAGNAESCASNDQRGLARDTTGLFFPIRSSSGSLAVVTLGGDCDLGSYED